MFVSSCLLSIIVFFFKQKTAYEMRISDWSSDVCSSDLKAAGGLHRPRVKHGIGVIALAGGNEPHLARGFARDGEPFDVGDEPVPGADPCKCLRPDRKSVV